MSSASDNTDSRPPNDARVPASAGAPTEAAPQKADDPRAAAQACEREGRLIEAAELWHRATRLRPDDPAACEAVRRLAPIHEAVQPVKTHNPPRMQVDMVHGFLVIRLGGVLAPYGDDPETGEHLDRLDQAVRALIQGGQADVVLDMHGVRFLGSHFLGILVTWARRSRSCGGCVAVCGLSAALWRVIELTKLSALIERYETLEAGADRMKRRRRAHD